MKKFHAVYEDGVFKPTEPVDLPEHCQVKVEPEFTDSEAGHNQREQGGVFEILARRYRTGDKQAAEIHNEHQP